MANECRQPGGSSSTADSYIGSFISLISKYEIRYDGVLYYLNPQDSTIGLKDVRSYGTEGRKKDGPQIPSSDKVYEYILFRGSDIKFLRVKHCNLDANYGWACICDSLIDAFLTDLQVKSFHPTLTEEQIHNDPAIIQSHYAGGPSGSSSSASVGGGALTESSSFQDTPALTTRAYPGALPSYQSETQVGECGHLQTTQNAGVPSYAMPMYWQGYNGTSSSISQSPQHPSPWQPTSTMLSPSTVQNLLQAPEIQASTAMGLINTSECVSAVPSNSVHPNFSPTLTPEYCFNPTDMLSSLSVKASLPLHSASMTANRLTTCSFPSTCQDINTIDAPIVGQAVSDPVSVLPLQSLSYSASSIVGSTSGPLSLPPTLLTPNQLSQPRPPVQSPTQELYPDQKDMGALTPPSPNSSSVTTPVVQAPLLPLPLSAQQSRCSSTDFTEEFDFIAMNEKFKKDEVWGYLGKANQRDKIEGPEDSAFGQSLGAEEGHGLVPNFDRKPAYSKDEFFDAISCNSFARGAKNGQNRFSERMKLDTETFGNFQQRPHLGYGGYGAGRGENYQGSYSWGRGYGYGGRGYGYGGRGYGYGGRGYGGNMPI